MEYAYQIMFATSMYILMFGMVSRFIRDTLHLPDSIFAMLYGGAVGAYALDLHGVDGYGPRNVLFGFARVVLALQVMTTSLQLPSGYICKRATSLLMLLFMVSLVSCTITFVIVASLSSFDIPASWAIAAACTTTDPILSSSIMRGRFVHENISERIRLLLAAESGMSDGVGLMLLHVMSDLVMKSPRKGVRDFLGKTVFLRTVCPVLIGYSTGRFLLLMLKMAHSKRLAGHSSMMAFGIVLAMASMCISIFLKESEFTFVFFVGTAFGTAEWFVLEARGGHLHTTVENIFNLSFFVFLGSRVDWLRLSMQNTLISLLILFFRRPPVVLVFYRLIPEIRTRREALAVGWFGPIGVNAIYYSLLADSVIGSNTIFFVQFLVVASVFIHGLTVPTYRLYLVLSKKTASTGEELQRKQPLNAVRI